MKNKHYKHLLIGLSAGISLVAIPPIMLLNNNSSQSDQSLTTLNAAQEIKKPATLDEWRKTDVNQLAKIAKFDAREYNIITPVKHQRRDNICWAYSIIAASEASMLLKGNVIDKATNQTLDLSENNIAVSVNRRTKEADKLGLTWEDLADRDTFQGFNILNGAQILFQQNTPIDEKDTWHKMGTPLAHTANVIKVKNDIDMIKKAVLQFGGVSFGYGMSHQSHVDNPIYYSNKYLNDKYEFHHAATIVGWDDNLDKSLWNGHNLSRNGGWIVKQSWGDTWGQNGYFYMSYDSLLEDIIGIDYIKKGTYENNYYYDGSVDASRYRYDGVNEVSAIFPTKRASYNRQEFVKAINVGVIGEDVTVNAKVYTGVQKVDPGNRFSKHNDPTNGNLVLEKTVKFDNPGSYGIYTIDFGKEAEIKAGEFFSVVVKVTNAKNNASVMFSVENSNNDMTFYKDHAKNTWANTYDINNGYVARIKALTNTKVKEAQKVNDLIYADAYHEKISMRYNSEEKPKPIVTFEGKKLVEGTDYELEYQETYEIPYIDSDDKIVGSGKVTIKGKGQYQGQTYSYYGIMVGLKPAITFGQYSESQHNPKIMMNANGANKYSDIYLPTGWEWVSGSEDDLSNGQNTGKYLEYKGEDAKLYRKRMFEAIVTKTNGTTTKTDLSSATVTINSQQTWTYDGQAKEPQVSVTLNGKTLIKDQDYALSHTNNINVGLAKIKVFGINSYQGTKELTFEIKKMKVQISVEVDQNGNVVIKSPNVANIADIQATHKYYKNKECTQELGTRPITPGTYYVKTFINSANHEITNQDALVKEFTITNSTGNDNNVSPKPNPDVNNNHGSNTAMVIALSTIIPTLGLSGIAYLIYWIIKRKRN